MKALLLYRDRDFDSKAAPPYGSEELIQDLEIETLLEAMSDGDKFIHDVAKKVILSSLRDTEEIEYRQHIISDCLEHEDVIRELYKITVEAIQGQKKVWRFTWRSPESILNGAVSSLELFVGDLLRLRRVADENVAMFRSRGFTRFFAMLSQELNDEYFDLVQDHLTRLKFPNGIQLSAELGKGNKGSNYVLHLPGDERQSWIKRVLKVKPPNSFEVAERDISGHEALSELRERGLNRVANALAQSTDHILSFFEMLRFELAFYVGCLNLHERLSQKGEPTSLPSVSPVANGSLSAQGLYDVCLTLRLESRAVGNVLDADNKKVILITGANQGGKTTFLRSLGLAFLMMQSGMFVGAEYFSASVCNGIYTHFKRKEDASMKSGKLDEELGRMSKIADHIEPGCVLLCNESFSSTNEREGSEIALQIVRAMVDGSIRVFYVTHLYELAEWLFKSEMETIIFLRAERSADGERTFKLVEGRPLSTSYGEDIYRKVFGQVA